MFIYLFFLKLTNANSLKKLNSIHPPLSWMACLSKKGNYQGRNHFLSIIRELSFHKRRFPLYECQGRGGEK